MSESPLKGYGYAPYIMHMIEQVTGHTFSYDHKHKPYRVSAELIEPVPESHLDATPGGAAAEAEAPSGGAPTGRASSPPHAPSRSYSPPSPIRRILSNIFGMCKDIRTTQLKEREARRKDTRTLKLLASKQELSPPRSPISDDQPSEPETEEQQQIRYDKDFAEFFQKQPSNYEFGALGQSSSRPSGAARSDDEDEGRDDNDDDDDNDE